MIYSDSIMAPTTIPMKNIRMYNIAIQYNLPKEKSSES